MKRTVSSVIVGLLVILLSSVASAQNTQYVRYSRNGGAISWGVLDGSTIHQLSDAPYLGGTRTGRSVARSAVKLEAPVDPKLVIMTAFNFRSHITGDPQSIRVSSWSRPTPSLAPKTRSSARQNLKTCTTKQRWSWSSGDEPKTSRIEDAPDYIFGVTAGNDVSERLWQRFDVQWMRAKGSRGFNAVGPVLVEGLDHTNLTIVGRMNGEERQRGSSSDLIFDMSHMVSYISHYFTLEPGDLIWSGTMGTTSAMTPGDVYEVEIAKALFK